MDTRKIHIIEKTPAFDKWLRRLKDLKAKSRILFRIQKIETDGHFGDIKSVGEGFKELRIDFGKSYRIYFIEIEGFIVLLLIGGDKTTQDKDIKRAKEICNNLNKSKS